MEPTQAKVFTALNNFQREAKPIEKGKDVNGKSFSYSYAPLNTIVEYIAPLLAKNGLGYFQTVKDKNMITVITHATGEFFESWLPFPMPFDQGLTAQQAGSWISYFRRYSLLTALGLATEEDDDGNAASNREATIADHQFQKKQVHKVGYSNAEPKNVVPESSLPKCHKCKVGKFVIKNGAKGSFYACNQYPKCKTSMNVEEAEQLAWQHVNTQVVGNVPPPEEYPLA